MALSAAWAAQVIYRDGGVHYFDSPIDLMQFLNNVPGFSPGYTRAVGKACHDLGLPLLPCVATGSEIMLSVFIRDPQFQSQT